MSYNPENPYVLNANYFQNITNVTYQDTGTFFIFRSLYFTSTILSLCLLALLLYLIIYKTPNQLRPYSRMLLICAVIDLYVITIDFCCQSVSKFRSYISLLSILANSGWKWGDVV